MRSTRDGLKTLESFPCKGRPRDLGGSRGAGASGVGDPSPQEVEPPSLAAGNAFAASHGGGAAGFAAPVPATEPAWGVASDARMCHCFGGEKAGPA
jgi:hypothetical protein